MHIGSRKGDVRSGLQL